MVLLKSFALLKILHASRFLLPSQLLHTSGATRYLFFVTRYGTRYLAKIVPRFRYSYLRLKSNSVLYGTHYGTLILDTFSLLRSFC